MCPNSTPIRNSRTVRRASLHEGTLSIIFLIFLGAPFVPISFCINSDTLIKCVGTFYLIPAAEPLGPTLRKIPYTKMTRTGTSRNPRDGIMAGRKPKTGCPFAPGTPAMWWTLRISAPILASSIVSAEKVRTATSRARMPPVVLLIRYP